MSECVKSKSNFSINFRFRVMTAAIIGAVILMLLLNYSLSMRAYEESILEANSQIMDMTMKNVDDSLAKNSEFLRIILTNNMNVYKIAEAATESESNLALYHLFQDMDTSILGLTYYDAFFILDEHYNTFNTVGNEELELEEKDVMRRYLEANRLDSSWQNGNWQIHSVENGSYLLIAEKMDGVMVGAWLSLDHLSEQMESGSFGENAVAFFTDGEGKVLAGAYPSEKTVLFPECGGKVFTADDGKRYLAAERESRFGGLILHTMVPMANISKELSTVRHITYATILGFAVLLICQTYFFKVFLVGPLNELVMTMRLIQSGTDELKARPQNIASEYREVYDTLDEMVKEIGELKIKVYEEELRKNDIMMEYLKQQVNPHFFLNCLNIIYSLTNMEDYKLIRQMVEYLIKYFRYIFSKTDDLVMIEDEISHLENFLHIQEMRYPNRFRYQIRVDEEAGDKKIPPLLIQTFVENAIKHSGMLSNNQLLEIQVTVLWKSELEITISDNGRGFSQEILEKLRNKESILYDNRKHIGIENAIRRTNVIFCGKEKISFYNDGGAYVKIMLPKVEGEESGREESGREGN